MLLLMIAQATTDLEVTYNAPGGSSVKHKQLLSNQPTDFQVRVHILEARKLFGNGSINPVVKVTCGKEVQHTSTQKSTINPIFDEVKHYLHEVCTLFNQRQASLILIDVFDPSLSHLRAIGPIFQLSRTP